MSSYSSPDFTMTNPLSLKIKLLDHAKGIKPPEYQSSAAAGMDLTAAIEGDVLMVLQPGQRQLIPTGIAIELPLGMEAQVRPRSGLALKHGITVLNSPGTIDADYRGEISVVLINHGAHDFVVERGSRIAQMVIAPVVQLDILVVDALSTTGRGTGGYGSTGTK